MILFKIILTFLEFFIFFIGKKFLKIKRKKSYKYCSFWNIKKKKKGDCSSQFLQALEDHILQIITWLKLTIKSYFSI